MILLILLILILTLQYYTIHYFFSCSLFLTSSFNLSILFIFYFANNPNSLSLSAFLKISHLIIKVDKSTSKIYEILLISSSSVFNFLFVSLFIYISCSLNNSSFFISFNMFFKFFSLSLNSSIIIYFFEGARAPFFIFEKLAVLI